MPAKKTCTTCGQQLSTAAFNGSSRTPDGLARTCRACTNARRRELERERTRAKPVRPVGLTAALRQGDIATVRQQLHTGTIPHWGSICELMLTTPPLFKGGQGGYRGKISTSTPPNKRAAARIADGVRGDVQSGGGTFCDPRLPLAELLLEAGVERNVFTMAAMGDVKGLTRRLRRTPVEARITARMPPVSERVTPLHVACASDWFSNGPERLSAQVQVAEILCANGAELNALSRYRGLEGANPLFCACWTSRSAPLARWLLDRGAHATDAHLLAALGHLQRHGSPAYDIAEILLAWGLPVDGGALAAGTGEQGPGNRASVATIKAPHSGLRQQTQGVRLPPYSREGRGGSGRDGALGSGRRRGSTAAIPHAGKNPPPPPPPREPESHPRTPLQAFAHQANHRTVAWLLAHGADVNARGPGGRTAAHFAAERNSGPATLALLVEHGADLSARDDDGHTPVALARLNEKLRLVDWIARRVRAKK